jgi:hypothetical protein
VELKQAPHPVAQAWQEVVMTLRKYPMLQPLQVGWLPVVVLWSKLQTLQALGHITQKPLARTKPARHLTHMGLELALVCVQVPQF